MVLGTLALYSEVR